MDQGKLIGFKSIHWDHNEKNDIRSKARQLKRHSIRSLILEKHSILLGIDIKISLRLTRHSNGVFFSTKICAL